jgi:hypothetical protein
MSQNSNQTFGEFLRSLAEAAIIGAIFMLILKGFVMLAALLLPKDKDGQPNKAAVVVLAMMLMVGSIFLLNAVYMPKYHYIVNASPAEQRGMSQRKCMFQVTQTYLPGALIPNNHLLRSYCVALDAPDLPDNLQNQIITTGSPDARDLLSRRGIKYNSSHVVVGSYLSDNSAQFSGPVWLWADGTRPRTEKYWYF